MVSNRYRLIYDTEFPSCLSYIDKKYWKFIKEKIEEQLLHQPNVATINKKPLTNPKEENVWELRCGPNNTFRVFYKILQSRLEVFVLSVGIKEREKIYIQGEEVEL